MKRGRVVVSAANGTRPISTLYNTNIVSIYGKLIAYGIQRSLVLLSSVSVLSGSE